MMHCIGLRNFLELSLTMHLRSGLDHHSKNVLELSCLKIMITEVTTGTILEGRQCIGCGKTLLHYGLFLV